MRPLGFPPAPVVVVPVVVDSVLPTVDVTLAVLLPVGVPPVLAPPTPVVNAELVDVEPLAETPPLVAPDVDAVDVVAPPVVMGTDVVPEAVWVVDAAFAWVVDAAFAELEPGVTAASLLPQPPNSPTGANNNQARNAGV